MILLYYFLQVNSGIRFLTDFKEPVISAPLRAEVGHKCHRSLYPYIWIGCSSQQCQFASRMFDWDPEHLRLREAFSRANPLPSQNLHDDPSAIRIKSEIRQPPAPKLRYRVSPAALVFLQCCAGCSSAKGPRAHR